MPAMPRHAHELAVPAPPPVVSPMPGCHNCPHWRRTFSTIGTCQILEPPWHKGWTTSYAYICSAHPSQETRA